MLSLILKMADLPRSKQRKRKNEAGFSLTEVMVAVFIIGLLSFVAMGPVLSAMEKGRQTAVTRDLGTLEQALTQYYMEMGEYPSTNQGLEALFELPTGSDKADRYRPGGYLSKRQLLEDPWGNAYQYQYPGDHSRFDLYSLGADGRPGGEGLDADLNNWD